MTRYLISFDHGAMDHISDEEGPAVGEAAHAVVQEARDAGVFVFAGGLTALLFWIDRSEPSFEKSDSPVAMPHRRDGGEWSPHPDRAGLPRRRRTE